MEEEEVYTCGFAVCKGETDVRVGKVEGGV